MSGTDQVLWSSLKAVGTLAVMASGGVFLKRVGLMTPQISRGLSEISMKLTIPCLLFTTAIDCAQDWSDRPCTRLLDQLAEGWPMLLLPALYVGVGVLVGHGAVLLGGIEESFRSPAIAAVAFGNSTGLPITLLAVVQAQFSQGTDLGFTNPLVFLSVYLVLYPVLQWTVGAWLLSPRPPEVTEGLELQGFRRSSWIESPSFKVMTSRRCPLGQLGAPGAVVPDCRRRAQSVLELPSRTRLSTAGQSSSPCRSFPDVGSPVGAPGGPRRSDDVAGSLEGAGLDLPLGEAMGRASSAPHPDSAPAVDWALVQTLVERVFPPPVIAALLGMLVNFMYPLRGLLVDSNRKEGAIFQWVFNGLKKIGQAAVPINMFILGNTLTSGISSGSVPMRTAIVVTLAKMVVMPTFGLLVCLAMKSARMISDGPDEAFYLVATIVTATPTANNLMVMAELAGGKNKEGLATCIFVMYASSPLLLTFWLAIYTYVATKPW